MRFLIISICIPLRTNTCLTDFLYLFLGSANVSEFLWNDTKPVANSLFPENQLGQYVLKRDRVVKKVKDAMVSQRTLRPEASQSVYLSGCRGSGKTSLLALLARSFKAEGYEVYFFNSAQRIPQHACSVFEALLADNTKKVAVLIDEVASNPDSALFITLLKGSYPHLVTIGAAVPSYIPTRLTAVFKEVLRMTDLVLKEEDEDFQELVQYCVGLKATTPELTETVCVYLLRQCGGHTFPTLAFIEHFFTCDSMKNFLVCEEEFYRYFCGQEFSSSMFYKSVRDRCFQQILDAEIEKIVFRILGCIYEAGDISTMIRLGWWDPVTNDFISRFLVNVCLSGVKPVVKDVIYLDEKRSHEENTELVIMVGLSCMDESDFKCCRHESGVKVEDGVSFNWAQKARAKIPNAYLSFQERSNSGRVDFYLNGIADTAIEVLLNATQTAHPTSAQQSQDIDGHLERFRSDQYHWKRYILFNFALNSKDVILPRDISAHDKVYTFVYSTNTLYRGNKAIKMPAVPKLSGGSRLFSTNTLRAGVSRGAKSTVSLFMHFMTSCMRRL